MGLFKFLKKDQKKADDLDLPPPPPELGPESVSDLPEFPDIHSESDPAMHQNPIDDFKFEMPKFPDMPDINMPDMPDEIPQEIPEEEPKIDVPKPQIPIPPLAPRLKEPVFAKPIVPEIPVHDFSKEQYAKPLFEKTYEQSFEKRDFHRSRKPVFIRVDDFKKMLGIINSIRGDLRRSDEALIKLETIKSTKDKSFDKVKFLLEDAQKKLIFMDKTLFKGG